MQVSRAEIRESTIKGRITSIHVLFSEAERRDKLPNSEAGLAINIYIEISEL